MTARRGGLGRGLEALIPVGSSEASSGFAMVPVDQVATNPQQPRSKFDEEALSGLAESIREVGVLQPISVSRTQDGSYVLIAGERRLRAARRAGLSEIPAVIRTVDDQSSLTQALVENIQRQDLNALEEASAYQRLIDVYGFTQQTLANKVGKSRSAVANTVRLLQLPPTVQAYVLSGELSSGHARALVGVSADEAVELADLIVKHGYTVREAEELAREARNEQTSGVEPAPTEKKEKKSTFRDDAQVREIVDALQGALGTKIKVKDRNGKGHIEIHYADYDVLQDVLDRLIE